MKTDSMHTTAIFRLYKDTHHLENGKAINSNQFIASCLARMYKVVLDRFLDHLVVV